MLAFFCIGIHELGICAIGMAHWAFAYLAFAYLAFVLEIYVKGIMLLSPTSRVINSSLSYLIPSCMQ